MCDFKIAFEGLLNIGELFEDNVFWYRKAPESISDVDEGLLAIEKRH